MTADEVLRAIDFCTIVLLFLMTLIVAHLHLGGFFDWVAELTVLRLNAHQLLAAVVFRSGILCAFLVNDVVCLRVHISALRPINTGSSDRQRSRESSRCIARCAVELLMPAPDSRPPQPVEHAPE